jgi:hypothetical protein
LNLYRLSKESSKKGKTFHRKEQYEYGEVKNLKKPRGEFFIINGNRSLEWVLLGAWIISFP